MGEYATHCKADIMSQILDIRYTDLEKEKEFCLELLSWAKAEHDVYGKAFAYTYLGDYNIAMSFVEQAKYYLNQADSCLSSFSGECSELYLRIYSLLGLSFWVNSDEQTSVQYYMHALHKARYLKDTYSEGLILNNLGDIFMRHNNHEEARKYLEEASRLLEPWDDKIMKVVILGNLAQFLLVVKDYDGAKKRIEECDRVLEHFPDEREENSNRNWCCYYAAINDEENAILYAKKVLKDNERGYSTPLNAYENFSLLFDGMFRMGNKEYARYFLEMMEKSSVDGALEHIWKCEESRLKYCLRFEPKEDHAKAYRTLYEKSIEIRNLTNKNIISAMKLKISMEDEMKQSQKVQTENENLERQANMDELTQIFNRRYLETLMRDRAGNTNKKKLGMIMLDVDYFKEYNDFYGHVEGDRVLQAVSSCLWENRRKGIFPCRYGGDEFACFCDDFMEDEIVDYIQTVRNDLYDRNVVHEKSHCSDRVTLSIGYSVDQDGISPYLLLQRADEALYDTKLSGRNSYKVK